MSSKDIVLGFLEQNKDRYISGQDMADTLGYSRNAVWKAITDLRSKGYEIDAVKNRGYRLSPKSDILSVQGISSFLDFEPQIHIYDSLASTNRTALEMAIDGAGHGTVVIAGEQTMGRGRFGRDFISPPGGLSMSLILRPDEISFEQPELVTAFIGGAVCDAVSLFTAPAPGIKWVNDIYIEDKKVCGILTESGAEYETGQISYIVAGIGINIDTDMALFPEEYREHIGRLSDFTDEKISRNNLCAEIIKRILPGTLPSKKEVIDLYRSKLLYIGKEIRVTKGRDKSECFEARATDIDDECHLIVRGSDGMMQKLSYREHSIVIK